MPTVGVYLPTPYFTRVSEVAANETPSRTPEALIADLVKTYVDGLNRAKAPKRSR